MANYYGFSRTNYFRVTDEEKYKELFNLLTAEDGIEDFTFEKDKVIYHGFGSYSSIYTKNSDEDEYGDEPVDNFICQLQEILPNDECFIYQEIGYEKLRYLTGFALIATHDKCDSVDISSDAIAKARELLGNDKFETRLDY